MTSARELDRSHVIAVANRKGGAGKTVTVINLGYELALLGYRVLLIDMDQQGNLTGGLGVTVTDETPSLFEVLNPKLAERVELVDAILPTVYGPGLVAAHDGLAAIESGDPRTGPDGILARGVAALPDPAVVLLDCPPALGKLTVEALKLADDVVIPVKPNADDLTGMQRLIDTIDYVAAGPNPAVKVMGVLMCQYDGRNQLNQDLRKQVLEAFEDRYFGEIASTVRVPESQIRGKPVSLHAPRSTAAEDYQRFGQWIAERIGK